MAAVGHQIVLGEGEAYMSVGDVRCGKFGRNKKLNKYVKQGKNGTKGRNTRQYFSTKLEKMNRSRSKIVFSQESKMPKFVPLNHADILDEYTDCKESAVCQCCHYTTCIFKQCQECQEVQCTCEDCHGCYEVPCMCILVHTANGPFWAIKNSDRFWDDNFDGCIPNDGCYDCGKTMGCAC
jgi:hypothetical protein